MISKQTQELINKAKYNALHHKRANELCAKSLGISVDELHERFNKNLNKKEQEKRQGNGKY